MRKYVTLSLLFSLVACTAMSQSLEKLYCHRFETPACFSDTLTLWDSYHTQNVDINIPIFNCAPPGTYKTEIRFLIERDGTIRDVKALTAYGYGMEAEVARVIERSPKWVPGTQNGKKVRAYRKQPFTFVIPEFSTQYNTHSMPLLITEPAGI